MRHLTSNLLLAALLLASLAGCSLQRPVAQHAVAYNRAVEQAHNEAVLLNVVRSMKRHPQHYTAITEVRGTASSSLTPSLSLVLKSGEATPWLPSGSGTLSDQTLITFSVLDDQEFMQGLLSPVSLDQLRFFLAQGWPERLMGMLFVRQIDIHHDSFTHAYCGDDARDTNGATTSYTNEPDESDPSDPFKRVKCFAVRLAQLRDVENLQIEDKTIDSIHHELETSDQNQLASLILQADKAGMKIKKGKPNADGAITYSLIKSTKANVLKWGKENQRTEVYSDPVEFQQAARGKGSGDTQAGAMLVYLRSAQSVVYYLGEIMRAQATEGFSSTTTFAELEPKIVSGGEVAVLFAAWQKGPKDKNPIAAVEHEGTTYIIPRFANCDNGRVDGCHRSMQALAIVKQLIGLNKNRESLSTTGVVTAIGG